MYFPTQEELRYAHQGLLPAARRQPVAEELRGWSWTRPPLQPVYGGNVAVEEVADAACPTGRDRYLRTVEGVQAPGGAPPEEAALRRLGAALMAEAKRLVYLHGATALLHVERLLDVPLPLECAGASEAAKLAAIRRFEARRLAERLEAAAAAQPGAGPDALAALAFPVCVELRLDGRCLGLSPHQEVDGFGLAGRMAIALRYGPRAEGHRLATAGYALVAESLFEAPVDLGCVVYVAVVDGSVAVERDIHVIDDESRQLFVELRDERLRAVAEAWDPGVPAECPPACGYWDWCRPGEARPARGPERPRSANLPTPGPAGPWWLAEAAGLPDRVGWLVCSQNPPGLEQN